MCGILKTMKKDEKTKKIERILEGSISISSKGTGYVSVAGQDEDIEIGHAYLNTALHGDIVEVLLHPKTDKRVTGEITKIVSRSKIGFAGILEEENGIFFLNPDDTKMYTDILIPEKMLGGAKNGEKVFAEIVSWSDPRKAPEGKIIKILGKPGENNTEMLAIALEKGFAEKLPDEVEREAEKIKQAGIKKEDLAGRRDFRNTLTFTIDPSDAKDFDDAISFRILPSLDKEGVGGGNSKNHHPAQKGTPPTLGGELYEIGIHIADVSHYVKIGSELDKEAEKRGTSVYLVDRTIPMLPEALSNNLCSLVPNEDRLTMSAVFTIDQNAKVNSAWFGCTVIHSQKRFTYEEAEVSIKNTSAPLHRELDILNKLAKQFTKERFANGAISLDQEEVKFVLDENGVPTKVIKKERGDSNRLIEEFMLLANKKVAELMSAPTPQSKESGVGVLTKSVGNKNILVYRIHDIPSKEKMSDLALFLRSLGHKVTLKNGIIPSYEINKILRDLEGKPGKDTVHRAVIRSMQKAIYSTKNLGHYGLAFEYYTHFTSPIRRYPDIIVHRMLMDFLGGKKSGNAKERYETYERLSMKLSDREKKATEAERASIKYKQVEYMSSRVGSEFEGVISGVSEWGIFVEEIDTKSEGMVRVRDMSDDFYIFNEKHLELVGQKKKKIYKLGDKVKIKLKGVDLEKKTIDYVLR